MFLWLHFCIAQLDSLRSVRWLNRGLLNFFFFFIQIMAPGAFNAAVGIAWFLCAIPSWNWWSLAYLWLNLSEYYAKKGLTVFSLILSCWIWISPWIAVLVYKFISTFQDNELNKILKWWYGYLLITARSHKQEEEYIIIYTSVLLWAPLTV